MRPDFLLCIPALNFGQNTLLRTSAGILQTQAKAEFSLKGFDAMHVWLVLLGKLFASDCDWLIPS